MSRLKSKIEKNRQLESQQRKSYVLSTTEPISLNLDIKWEINLEISITSNLRKIIENIFAR